MRSGLSRHRNVFAIALLGALLGASQAGAVTCTPGAGTVTCTGGAGSEVAVVSGDGTTHSALSGFGSTIAVTGGSGTVSGVQITLHGYASKADLANDPFYDGSFEIGLMLVSPDGSNLEVLRGVGYAGTPQGVFAGTGLEITLADTGSAIPDGNDTNDVAWNTSGTYKPASYPSYNNEPDYASAGAPTLLDSAAPQGPFTLASAFTGGAVNGNWKLYLVSDTFLSTDVKFTSWDITITSSAASVATTTTLSANPTTAFTGGTNSSVTLTATVTSGSGTPTGQVTFMNDASNLTCAGGNPAALSGGQATCSTTFSSEGYHGLSANYAGNSTYISSTGTAGVFSYNHATSSGTNYCNSGALSSTASTDTTVYPSVIYVGDGTAGSPSIPSDSVSTIAVKLSGFSSSDVNGLHMMVVSPDGHAFDFLGEGGGGSASPGTYLIQDGGASVPNSSISPGTYAPVSNYSGDSFVLGTPFPVPAPQPPGGFSLAPPSGSASFETSMLSAHANGAWLLFVDNEGTTHTPIAAMSMTGGWCVDITAANGFATATSVTSNPTPKAVKGAPITFTATVTSGGHGVVNEGTVDFTEDGAALTGAPNGGVASVSGGVAAITTSSLPEGDHTITATYHDGGGTFNDSLGTVSVRVDAATSTPTLSGGAWSYCNGSGITIPKGTQFVDDIGPATPNPSNITVTHLPGTVSSATLTINTFSVTFPGDLESLVVGANGNSLDFFSQTGGTVSTNFVQTMTFSDAAASLVPAAGPVGTLVKPTSRNGTSSYTASPFYTLPAITYASPNGLATFASQYQNSNANGLWSLYFDQLTHHVADGAASWCMNFTENPVVVTATKAHVGSAPSNHFVQGETGAQFTIDIHNSGPGSTGDPDNNHPLVVSDTLDAAFTYASASGSGWSCSASLQVVTCSNHNTIAQDGDYPQLVINVNVANAATPGAVNNTASLSGGGITATSTNTDSVTVDPAPDVTVTAGHTGTFTQGQTGQVDITGHNAAAGSHTAGTATVVDTLPAGWTLSSYNSTGNVWTCGSLTNTVTCTDGEVVAGIGDYTALHLIVQVPSTSAVNVTNNVTISGGGELASANGNNSSSDPLTVIQVPDSIAINAGGTQSAQISTAFGTAMSVIVKDAASVVINNSPVIFTVAPGGSGQSGTFSNSTGTITANTDSSGIASAGTFTANATPGAYTVDVADGPAPHATFNLTNVALPTLSKSFSPSTIPLNGTSTLTFTIGNPAGNATLHNVSFSDALPSGVAVASTPALGGSCVVSSNGTVTAAAAATTIGYAGGVLTTGASCTFFVNVTATTSGVKSNTTGAITSTETPSTTVTASSTLTVLQPTDMNANTNTTPQTAQVTTAFATNLGVTVLASDHTTPVPGVQVTFTIPGSNASFPGPTGTAMVTTDSSGVATAPVITAGTAAGPQYSVTAAASGLTTVSFLLTNTAGPAANVAVANGGTQSTAINTAFGSPLVVLVTDAHSNPVSGATVAYAPPGSGATAALSSPAVTDSNGNTSVTATANGTAGAYAVVASVSGGATSATFNLTNTASTTTTASNASANFSATDQPVTLNATVTSAGGTVNVGTVTFTVKNGPTTIGSPVTSGTVTGGAANASFTLPGGTAANAYTIQAVYNAAGVFLTSSDSTHTLTVGTGSTTTTAANASATFSGSDQLVSLSATVTSGSGTVNEGTVTFTIKNGPTTIGVPVTSGTVTSGAAGASFTVPGGTAAGPYTIQAVYNPSVSFATSSDNSHTLTVNGAVTHDRGRQRFGDLQHHRPIRFAERERHQRRGHGECRHGHIYREERPHHHRFAGDLRNGGQRDRRCQLHAARRNGCGNIHDSGRLQCRRQLCHQQR